MGGWDYVLGKGKLGRRLTTAISNPPTKSSLLSPNIGGGLLHKCNSYVTGLIHLFVPTSFSKIGIGTVMNGIIMNGAHALIKRRV